MSGTRLVRQIKSTNLPGDLLACWYVGQMGYILKYANITVGIDLYLTDYVDQNVKSKIEPWKRLYPPPVTPLELSECLDYVLVTHSHYDHADPWTLKEFASNKHCKFISPHCMKPLWDSLGIDDNRVLFINNEECLTLGKINIKAFGVAHHTENIDSLGYHENLAYYIEFSDKISAFHGGDFYITKRLLENTAGIAPSIAFLPVNGTSWRRTVADIIGNINTREALDFSRHISAKLLIPSHYDLYEINGENPAIIADLIFREYTEQAYHLPRVGERFIISEKDD